jgi:hypothetical protein
MYCALCKSSSRSLWIRRSTTTSAIWSVTDCDSSRSGPSPAPDRLLLIGSF